MQPITGQADDRPTEGHYDRARERLGEQRRGQAVREGEVGVDDLEGKRPPEPPREAQERQVAEHTVQELPVTRHREESGMVDGQTLLVFDRRDRRPLLPDQPVQREPGNRRHHHHFAAPAEAPDPLAYEDAPRGLRRAREGRADHQNAHQTAPR